MVKRERFPLILVKASHYDDACYVIQRMRFAVPLEFAGSRYCGLYPWVLNRRLGHGHRGARSINSACGV